MDLSSVLDFVTQSGVLQRKQSVLLDIRPKLITEGYKFCRSYKKCRIVWDDNKAHTDKDILNRWFEFLTTNTDFDQAIIETSNGKDFWIHVSCRKNKKKNRHQIIRYLHK